MSGEATELLAQFAAAVKYDDVAERGELTRMPGVFAKPTALEALDAFIDVFPTFWLSDRVLMRRLRGLGTLDAEIAGGIRAREGRRRLGLRTIVTRMTAESGRPVIMRGALAGAESGATRGCRHEREP